MKWVRWIFFLRLDHHRHESYKRSNQQLQPQDWSPRSQNPDLHVDPSDPRRGGLEGPHSPKKGHSLVPGSVLYLQSGLESHKCRPNLKPDMSGVVGRCLAKASDMGATSVKGQVGCALAHDKGQVTYLALTARGAPSLQHMGYTITRTFSRQGH